MLARRAGPVTTVTLRKYTAYLQRLAARSTTQVKGPLLRCNRGNSDDAALETAKCRSSELVPQSSSETQNAQALRNIKPRRCRAAACCSIDCEAGCCDGNGGCLVADASSNFGIGRGGDWSDEQQLCCYTQFSPHPPSLYLCACAEGAFSMEACNAIATSSPTITTLCNIQMACHQGAGCRTLVANTSPFKRGSAALCLCLHAPWFLSWQSCWPMVT